MVHVVAILAGVGAYGLTRFLAASSWNRTDAKFAWVMAVLTVVLLEMAAHLRG